MMKVLVSDLRKKWRWLNAQADFRRAPVRTSLRFIAWAIWCSLRTGTKVRLGRWNVKISLPARWRGVEKLIFVFREDYETELAFLDHALSSGKNFVDVGANLGIYTLVASKIVGSSGRVIAFEPAQQSFLLLNENVALNNCTNVQTYPVAIADKAGKAFLYHGPDPGQNSLGRDCRLAEGGEEVMTQSLDDALGAASVKHVDVIKIDVEGAEELVVRGANNVLTSCRPTIIFEINQEASTRLGLSPRGAWDLLQSLGYTFFNVQGKVVLQTRSLPMLGNIVAIHDCSNEGKVEGFKISHRAEPEVGPYFCLKRTTLALSRMPWSRHSRQR